MNYSPIVSRLSYGNKNNKGVNAFNGIDDPSFSKYDGKFSDKTVTTYKNHNTALKGLAYCEKGREDYGIAEIFFSPDNMKRLQKMIKKEVFLRTDGQFRLDVDQDEADLLISMRAVYLEHARFLPFKIVHQVKLLNKKLVEYIIGDMVTNIKQHYAYIKEINSPIKPIDRPLNVSNAGRKTAPAISTLFF